MKSPFKFLDSYTKEDLNIFFGRDREIKELYQSLFESNIMLVYGISGTGKSSLIHCGLANKINETDWLPITVRRGRNIIESLAARIGDVSITPQVKKLVTPADFKKGVRSLYLDHYKLVFFIFDQFEELFIFGDKEERKEFIQTVKALSDRDLHCHFIFIMREEYMAGITEFEKYIPTIFSNRVRIEKMSHQNATEVITGPCKVFNINVEEGFATSLLEKLSPGSDEVELTYLQVFLDKIFRLATSSSGGEGKGDIDFTLSLLEKTGNVTDLLGSFLDDQISELSDPEAAITILKAFVSAKGTKRPASVEEVGEYALTTGKPVDENTINDLLHSLVNLRILQDKDHNGRYELKHDALASKIYEKITLAEKEMLEIRQLIENAYHAWEKRGVFLSGDDLKYIAPYESRLYLPDEQKRLITRSKFELVRAKHRRRNIISITTVSLIIILSGLSIWAVRERQNAIDKERIAREEKLKAESSEKEAIKARDMAVISDKKAVEARNRAELSELNILKEKEISELREQQARANNFNYLSKEVVNDDATLALRLAEYALSLYPGNQTIRNNLNSIYYDNSFYTVFTRFRKYNLCVISPDWKRILSTNGRSAVITDLHTGASKTLIGHRVKVFISNDPHGFSRRGYDDVISINFSPSGKLILTGSSDRTARLWDTDGKCIQVFSGHILPVLATAFSPDENTFLTTSSDLTAKLWDLGGNCILTLKGHKMAVNSAAFSPDGNFLLTGSDDSTAILWDHKGTVVQKFSGHSGGVRVVAFSPDGETILTGSNDQTARLWDLKGNTLQSFEGHTGIVKCVSFSHDGKFILTGSGDKTARLWDMNGNTIQVFKGHLEAVNSIYFSHDGKNILTFSAEGISRLWDISECIYKNFSGHNNIVFKALFSPDGKAIMTLSADQTIRLWDLDGNSQPPIKQVSNSIDFSPDGKTILTGFVTAQLLDHEGKPIKAFVGQKGVYSVAFSPDGKTIATGSPDGTTRLWNIEAGSYTTCTGHSGIVKSLCFSPDGKCVLTGSSDNTARLWDLKGNILQIFTGHTDAINSVAFSNDGRLILTGSDDKTARLWDLKGNTLQVYAGHRNFVTSVTFSPDNKYILTGSGDKTACLWDLNGNTLQIFRGYRSIVYSVAFSPDSKFILTGTGDKIARMVSVKKSLNLFIKENSCEELSIYNKLKYSIISISLGNNRYNTDELIEELEFCVSQAGLKISESNKYSDMAVSLSEIAAKNITSRVQAERFTNAVLGLYKINPDKSLPDKIAEVNRIFLRNTSVDDLLEAYDFISAKCNIVDKAKMLSKFPDYLIEIGGKLFAADSSVRRVISIDMAGITWPLLQNRQFNTALKAAEISLAADSTNQYLFTTYPLILLLNNRFDAAASVYRKYASKNMFGYIYGSYRPIFMSDIAELEKRGITHPDFSKVRSLLNE
jgi:WD40 repeat protein